MSETGSEKWWGCARRVAGDAWQHACRSIRVKSVGCRISSRAGRLRVFVVCVRLLRRMLRTAWLSRYQSKFLVCFVQCYLMLFFIVVVWTFHWIFRQATNSGWNFWGVQRDRQEDHWITRLPVSQHVMFICYGDVVKHIVCLFSTRNAISRWFFPMSDNQIENFWPLIRDIVLVIRIFCTMSKIFEIKWSNFVAKYLHINLREG